MVRAITGKAVGTGEIKTQVGYGIKLTPLAFTL